MTRRDYIILAQGLRQQWILLELEHIGDSVEFDNTVMRLCRVFKRDNDNFSLAKFKEAIYGSNPKVR
jgi:hypothetical protein